MFDRIVGGFAEGTGTVLLQLLMNFPLALLFSWAMFRIPRRRKHAFAALGISWILLGAIYVVFYYDSMGAEAFTTVGLFLVPFIISISALLVSDRLSRSRETQRDDQQ